MSTSFLSCKLLLLVISMLFYSLSSLLLPPLSLSDFFTCSTDKVFPQSEGDQWLLQPSEKVLHTATHHVYVINVGLKSSATVLYHNFKLF